MFWNEEDVQSAVSEATKLFGVAGSMESQSSNGYKNVSIATRQYGKLWYGDVSGNKNFLKAKAMELSKAIKQEVYVLPQDSFDFSKPLLVAHN